MSFKHFITENKQMVFDEHSTGMPMYDSFLSDPNKTSTVGWNEKGPIQGNYWKEYKHWDWKIVYISPDTYLHACAKGFGMSLSSVLATRTDLNHIQKLVDNGTKIDMPVLEYGSNGWFTQEGIHRALYAKQAGVKKIPVLIFTKDNREIKIEDLVQKVKNA